MSSFQGRAITRPQVAFYKYLRRRFRVGCYLNTGEATANQGLHPTMLLASGSTVSNVPSRLNGVKAMYRRPSTQMTHGGERDE